MCIFLKFGRKLENLEKKFEKTSGNLNSLIFRVSQNGSNGSLGGYYRNKGGHVVLI